MDELRERARALGLHGIDGRWDEIAGAGWIRELIKDEERSRADRLRRGLSFADIRARFGLSAAGCGFSGIWRDAFPDPAPACLVRRGIRRATLDACRPLIRRRGGSVLFAHRTRGLSMTHT